MSCIHMHKCLDTYMYTKTYLHIHIPTYIYIHTYMHAKIHKYIQHMTYLHKYISYIYAEIRKYVTLIYRHKYIGTYIQTTHT